MFQPSSRRFWPNRLCLPCVFIVNAIMKTLSCRDTGLRLRCKRRNRGWCSEMQRNMAWKNMVKQTKIWFKCRIISEHLFAPPNYNEVDVSRSIFGSCYIRKNFIHLVPQISSCSKYRCTMSFSVVVSSFSLGGAESSGGCICLTYSTSFWYTSS